MRSLKEEYGIAFGGTGYHAIGAYMCGDLADKLFMSSVKRLVYGQLDSMKHTN